MNWKKHSGSIFQRKVEMAVGTAAVNVPLRAPVVGASLSPPKLPARLDLLLCSREDHVSYELLPTNDQAQKGAFSNGGLWLPDSPAA